MEALPAELLLRVFGKLGSQERRCLVPLVCKTWRDVASQPSFLWDNVYIDVRRQPEVLLCCAQRFLKLRAAHMKKAVLLLPSEEAELAVVLLAALGPDSPLKVLVNDFGGGIPPTAFMAQLGWMRQLRALRLTSLRGPLETFHLGGFQRLHHLKALEISFETNAHLSAPGAFLKGFPKVLTTLTKLEFLAISHAGDYAFRVLPKGFSNLVRLTDLTFIDCGVQGFEGGFEALTALYCLVVCGSGVPRQIRFPRDLSAMTLLEDVELECREVPTCLSSLGHLTSLTLRKLQPSSRAAQSIEADFATLLEPLRLSELNIGMSRISNVPSAMTLQSGLTRLSLRGCGLSHLPPGPYLRNLRELDYAGNLYLDVPLTMLQAPRLETLTLYDGAAYVDVTPLRAEISAVDLCDELPRRVPAPQRTDWHGRWL